MTLSPTALEEAAKAAYHATPRNKPHSLLSKFQRDKLVTEVSAAITAYLAQAEKEGWVMVPLNPNYDMGETGMGKFASFHDEHPAACVDEIYRAMLAAAQNGGE